MNRFHDKKEGEQHVADGQSTPAADCSVQCLHSRSRLCASKVRSRCADRQRSEKSDACAHAYLHDAPSRQRLSVEAHDA
jgi:hypothetical protein